MNQDQLKQMVGEAARDEVLKLAPGQVLGVGTGSTANCFIDALAPHKDHFADTRGCGIQPTAAKTGILLRTFKTQESNPSRILDLCGNDR